MHTCIPSLQKIISNMCLYLPGLSKNNINKTLPKGITEKKIA